MEKLKRMREQKQLKLQTDQHPQHQNTIPSKKATTTSTLQKKIQESRRPRLKNWCAHFLKGEEFRSNQPWSHWFLNSMTLIESKVAMALFSATSLAASSSALTWGLWRQVVALFNAFLFKWDERKCINQVFQRRVESCCAAQIQEIHSWKSSSITLSCWVQENLSFITGYLDPRKKKKKIILPFLRQLSNWVQGSHGSDAKFLQTWIHWRRMECASSSFSAEFVHPCHPS